jgi:orotidine-5'-phosphate decarboxylase
MFVVGATHPETFAEVRRIVPDHFLLVPGVGAQGGDMETVLGYGRNERTGLLINVSRDILYASDGEDFAEKAREKALLYRMC